MHKHPNKRIAINLIFSSQIIAPIYALLDDPSCRAYFFPLSNESIDSYISFFNEKIKTRDLGKKYKKMWLELLKADYPQVYHVIKSSSQEIKQLIDTIESTSMASSTNDSLRKSNEDQAEPPTKKQKRNDESGKELELAPQSSVAKRPREEDGMTDPRDERTNKKDSLPSVDGVFGRTTSIDVANQNSGKVSLNP